MDAHQLGQPESNPRALGRVGVIDEVVGDKAYEETRHYGTAVYTLGD